MYVVYIVIGLAVGFVAYRSSENFKREHNVTPWHLPSLVWALIGFLSLLLCVVLFLIARKTTKPAAVAAYASAQTPLAGWYPDPSSQSEFRYWDGTRWTDRVENGGLERMTDT